MTIRQTNERPLISVTDAARELGISTSAAYRWLERDELPGAVHVGGRWWVRRRQLEAWLEGEVSASATRAA